MTARALKVWTSKTWADFRLLDLMGCDDYGAPYRFRTLLGSGVQRLASALVGVPSLRVVWGGELGTSRLLWLFRGGNSGNSKACSVPVCVCARSSFGEDTPGRRGKLATSVAELTVVISLLIGKRHTTIKREPSVTR